MKCCQCQGIECSFDEENARKKLDGFRKNGPAKTTRILIDALKAAGVEGRTLLDVGGGVGAIQHELAAAGASRMISVEASTAYHEAVREEAERRGYADRVSYQHGDFVDLAPDIEPVDVVTLDRVVCCYHDAEGLVGSSAALAGRLYGLVYPRDAWWVKLYTALANISYKIQRNPFRLFVHPTREVDALVRRHGLKPRFYRRVRTWQVVVYER
jgi:16S rRNA A1518/A1519 N6-dimethyltransferase RsmA/KsgA/DIM1 with predicted DNA glycosylase/AP lyase activity